MRELIDEQYYPYKLQLNDTTNFLSIKVEQEYYTSEELVAMILQNVKEIVQSFGGQPMKDCVLTVPSFFTQHEKEALYTAAHIADLNVLSLIEENTAAALNYGMDRVFEQPTNVLFYNLGAGSVQVTVVNYSAYSAKEAGKNKTIGQFEVIGKAWDSQLGGHNFDLCLTNLLARRFNDVWNAKKKTTDKDVRSQVRPMTRLKIESNKIKEILSANQEFPYRLEQLHDNIDLVGKITRTEFESECASLFDRAIATIDEAIAHANISVADIHSVELLGGSVRVPRVKKLIEEYFHKASTATASENSDPVTVSVPRKIEVGQHLNGDEAMALGASFRAANLSTQFRVRKVGMADISSFDIGVRVQTLKKDDVATGGFLSGLFGSKDGAKAAANEGEAAATAWEKHTLLFPAKTSFPTKNKLIAFPYDQDVVCKIEYEQGSRPLPQGTHPLIAQFNITGVAAFAKEHADKGVSPKIQLGFNIDNAGRVHLLKAEVLLELPANETAAEESAAANKTDASSNNSTATEKKKTVNVIRKTLMIAPDTSAVVPTRWSSVHISEARSRLRALQLADEQRRAKAQALNDLESYLYRVKNRLADDEKELARVSTEQQREEVLGICTELADWLDSFESNDATVQVFNDKQKELAKKAEEIFSRYSELSARKDAVTKGKQALDDVRKAVVNTWAEKYPQVTEEEKSELLALVQKIDQWIEDKVEAQDKIPAYEKPVFHSSEIAKELKPVRTLFEKLLKKPKPAPPVEKKEVSPSLPCTICNNATLTGNPHQNATANASAEAEKNQTVPNGSGEQPHHHHHDHDKYHEGDPEEVAKKPSEGQAEAETADAEQSAEGTEKNSGSAEDEEDEL